jgi:hypothetical protein
VIKKKEPKKERKERRGWERVGGRRIRDMNTQRLEIIDGI